MQIDNLMIDLSMLEAAIALIIGVISARLIPPSRCKNALCALSIAYFFLAYIPSIMAASEKTAGTTVILIGIIMYSTFKYLSNFTFPDAIHYDKIEIQSERTCSHMEQLLKQLIEGQKELFNEFKDLKTGQQQLKTSQDEILQRLGRTEGQQRENTDIIKAILHNQETANAKLEALALNTATRESVTRLEAKFDCLNDRLFNQEAEIRQLRAVK